MPEGFPPGAGPPPGGMGPGPEQGLPPQGGPAPERQQGEELVLDALQTVQMMVMEQGTPEQQQAFQAFLESMAQPMGGAEGVPGQAQAAPPPGGQMPTRSAGNVGATEAAPVL